MQKKQVPEKCSDAEQTNIEVVKLESVTDHLGLSKVSCYCVVCGKPVYCAIISNELAFELKRLTEIRCKD
jgi:hypothetical protein